MLTTKVFSTKKLLYFIQKTRLSNYFIFLLFCFIHQIAFSQNSKTAAFTLAKKGNDDVVLYKSNSGTNNWKNIGSTGRSFIRSLATDSKNEIIYAVDKGNLGTLDPNNGKFSVIGEIGSGSGEQGNIKIDNVYGLAFDANRNILYATQRTNDLDVLLQINPKSGKIIKGSMINSKGQNADYKTILIETFYFGSIYPSKKFIELAYNNERKILYIIHNYFSTLQGINSYTNIDTQKPTEEYRISPIQKLAGIAFDNDGKFFATFSDNKISTGGFPSGGGVTIDLGNLKIIDPNLSGNIFFYGLDFYSVQSCTSNLQVNSPPTSNATIKATYTIEANTLIYVDTKFIAGTSVSLNNNFEVRNSANFEVAIDSNACE